MQSDKTLSLPSRSIRIVIGVPFSKVYIVVVHSAEIDRCFWVSWESTWIEKRKGFLCRLLRTILRNSKTYMCTLYKILQEFLVIQWFFFFSYPLMELPRWDLRGWDGGRERGSSVSGRRLMCHGTPFEKHWINIIFSPSPGLLLSQKS